jgi:hypothetical protein
MAHADGNAHRAGGARSDAAADAGFILYRGDWLEMFKHRTLPWVAFPGLFLLFITACAVAPEAAAPAEEPAVLEMTAPAEVEEPAAEEPALEQPTEVVLFPATLPPSISGLKTPTPHIDLPPDGISPTMPGTTLPDTGGGEEPQPVVPETRRLTLEFPPVMRTGDSTRIRLRLEVDDQGNITPTAIVEGNVVTGEVVEIPNLYETHNVIAEARLDMAGMEVQPSGTISEPLRQGQSVTFYWSVRPEKSGKYEGAAWLHLRFVPRDGGEESRIPVSVQFLEIESKSFLGFLTGGTARGIGALGSVIGSVLGFPFVDDFAKWLWGKIRRK